MPRRQAFAGHGYGEDGGPSGANSIKWNAIALIGRQLLILLFSLVLARMLGPEAYGIIAQASIYIAFTTMLLDQGLTAAMISRQIVQREVASAASTVNLGLGLVLAIATFALAQPLSVFFRTPQLQSVLMVLGVGLLLKAAAIVPRMLLMRQMRFREIAIADVVSSLIGGVAGIAAAVLGMDYWALVVQLVVSDALTVLIVQVAARPPAPSLGLTSLRGDLGFSGRVFLGNLVSFASRNTDNVLVGRFFGADALAFYALAYRVLLTPVQMVGQVVTRVLFPAISRVRADIPRVGELILRSTSSIAMIAFPAMGFIAVSAADSVPLVLGDRWLPVIPVLQVLAITGARQAVTAVNGPVLLGLGLAKVHLRFNLLAAATQILGMVAGMPWGIFGVAVGYTVAGILLTPVVFWLQVKYAQLSVVAQVRSLWPPLMGTILACCAYVALSLVGMVPVARLIVGALLGGAICAGYVFLAHRSVWTGVISEVRAVVGRGN